jgi:MFS family permease
MSSAVRSGALQPPPDLAVRFLHWTFLRGLCARGYWLVTSVYLVVVADLSASELVLLGTGQGVTVLVAEIPAGVLADTVSRKWALVVAQLASGAGMVLAGLVTDFPTLVLSQALWGLGWAFSSGAEVAWLTDELDRPDVVDRVLAARARWDLTGAATGLVAFGALAWATDLRTGVVASGLAMAALGLVVAARFPEHRFTPAPTGRRWRDGSAILGRGIALARRDREVLLVLVAWLLVNGSMEGYGRLLQKQLVHLGFGAERPVLWFTALGLAGLLLGALVLRVVEIRIGGRDVARRTSVAGCALGVVGLVLFAGAPHPAWAVAGAMAVSGVTRPVLRAVSEIWVNRRATSDVRATVGSFLSQAEHLGEITLGLLLAAVASVSSLPAAVLGSALLLALAGAVVSRARSA